MATAAEPAEAARTARIGVGVVSVAPPSLPAKQGLSALLYLDVRPYRQYAQHLASFGAQAALVAGSPYYQLLIGRILGYKEDHIRAHVAEGGGSVTAAVDAEVAKDMRRIAKRG